MDQTPGTDKPRRVIKRYSNRKLYDTKDSRYVTLQQIGEMVRAGEEVQIIDNATKEDKTEVTLALIISEDLKSKPRSVPLGTLRDLIQERGERVMSALRESPIGRLIPGGEGGEVEGGEAGEAGQAGQGAAKDASGASTTPAGDEKPVGAKARLSEIVESSRQTLEQFQHTIDERVRAVIPGLKLVRDLQADVKRLTQRVDELETKLGQASSPRE